MATTLSVHFLAGRYHATGWDHQVNEGTTEWPPSPWRILRALVSAAHRSLSDPQQVSSILQRLASTLPSYVLPGSTEHHTRHYMPTDKSSTKVFDTFRVLEGGASRPATLRVCWADVALDEQDRVALSTLLRSVGYLGRSQSWVEMALEDGEDGPNTFNCTPTPDGAKIGMDTTRVLAPMADAEYSAWVDGLDKKARKRAPASTWEVLSQSTAALKQAKWTEAPGSRWVNYTVMGKPQLERQRPKASARTPCTSIVLALQSRVLPPEIHTLCFGEAVRRALLCRADGHPVFSGKDESGGPAQGHRHAYCLPYDQDGEGRLDHVLVHATGGLSGEVVAAIARLTRLSGKNTSRHPISVHLESRWSEADAPHRHAPRLLRSSRTWRSLTPMVLPRFPKVSHNGQPRVDKNGYWIDGPIAQVHLALDRLGLPARKITMPDSGGVQAAGEPAKPWFQYDRKRKSGSGARYPKQAFCFELIFEQLVRGPIAIGYACHFGLGLFAPVP
ncbi:MAG: type I-U CRISPR-associated protein Csb2 [Nannocystaceae bacterium]